MTDWLVDHDASADSQTDMFGFDIDGGRAPGGIIGRKCGCGLQQGNYLVILVGLNGKNALCSIYQWIWAYKNIYLLSSTLGPIFVISYISFFICEKSQYYMYYHPRKKSRGNSQLHAPPPCKFALYKVLALITFQQHPLKFVGPRLYSVSSSFIFSTKMFTNLQSHITLAYFVTMAKFETCSKVYTIHVDGHFVFLIMTTCKLTR